MKTTSKMKTTLKMKTTSKMKTTLKMKKVSMGAGIHRGRYPWGLGSYLIGALVPLPRSGGDSVWRNVRNAASILYTALSRTTMGSRYF